jgi:hypothetical protein
MQNMAHMRDRRGAYGILVGRPRHRWEYHIKMDLQEVGWGGMDWTALAEGKDRLQAVVNAIINLQGPYNAQNFLTS